ncbi:MAG: mechanosensitive ion channel family protein [Nanoarchaeota archaeon]|nr:mechanosensitive ion channel family protein [Nanoarchaeota archaeon]MBU1320979.1 mechanosensitive ion channel family protein [Nanoarchaeota archaeon]MBU1598364.1 mechanosensitive ion channel family protein [Nanoarchaeota archaeon]MBU2441734.1 mechanosensitive ion channel family protein [Nanoarchaeota archaeon]
MADAVNDSIQAITGVTGKVTPVVTKIVIAVLILLIGLIIGKLIGNLLRRLLNEIQLDKQFRTTIGLKFSLEKTISGFVMYFIYFIAIVMALNSLGLTTAILHMISAAIIVIIVVSFILAVKDFFPNFIAGIRIRNKKLFNAGDEIQIKEVRGKISSIDFLETRIITKYNEEVIIPNSIFNRRQVVIRKKAFKSQKPKKKK